MAQVETGWLIEEVDDDGNSKMKAFGVIAGINPGWVGFDKALRFSRKEDAENLGRLSIRHKKWKAIEHSWE